MNRSIFEPIENWLDVQTERRLAVVVSLDVQRLSTAVSALEVDYSLRTVHLGGELGESLLSAESGRRIVAAERWVLQECRDADGDPLVLGDIDLLFHPHLAGRSGPRLDPLKLFQRASQLTPIAVMWPGSVDGATLRYGVPEHHHFRYWPRPSAFIIDAN